MAYTPPKFFAFMGINMQGDLGPITTYKNLRGKQIFYPKSPPLSAPSPLQNLYRAQFRALAKTWLVLTNEEKANWEKVTKVNRIFANGIALFFWYCKNADGRRLKTFCRNAGLTPNDLGVE